MSSGFDFLVVAKQREIAELLELARTSELVSLVGRLIHEIQRERGASNIYLGSRGQRFAAQRQSQSDASRAAEAAVRERFDSLLSASSRCPTQGSRLFGRLAYVVQGLDGLDDLRSRIIDRRVSVGDASQAFITLIAGLLAVVFEAIDSAASPEISRLLVALFNFMQGKEFAGQERALGSGFYAAANISSSAQRELVRLIDAQERCFEVFTQFITPAPLALWQQVQKDTVLIEFEQLRRVACTATPEDALDPDLCNRWFDCCTRRIDLMKTVEDSIEADVHAACSQAISVAQTELHHHEQLLRRARAEEEIQSMPPLQASLFFPSESGNATPPTVRYGRQLERSMLEMVLEQSARLQAMRDELTSVRSALDDRKVIERAKGVLMAAQGLSEENAYRRLQHTAMNENRRLVDVAAAVLALSDYLVPHPTGGHQ